MHPDVVEFEPGAASYSVKTDVRERILPEAHRSPIEAEHKVLLLFEAEKLRGNQNESANAMLKTLEEPPDRTILVLVTSVAEDLLPTIRSRCQRIDFDPVADDALAAALAAEGVDSAQARACGRALGRPARTGARDRGPARQPARVVRSRARPDGRHRCDGARRR